MWLQRRGSMFASKQRGTVIAEGLKVVGGGGGGRVGRGQWSDRRGGSLYFAHYLSQSTRGRHDSSRAGSRGRHGRGPDSRGKCHAEIGGDGCRRYSPPISCH